MPTSTAPRDRPPPRAVTALAGFLCALLAAPGQTFVLALYVEPLMGSLDASRATVSHWYTVATLSAAVLLVPVGRLADRWPPERFLLAVLIGMGFALIILSRGTAAWQVIATFTALRLCGQGATGVGILALVVRRFASGRGRLLSITQLGHPAGELIFPSLILLSLQWTDWRDSMAAVGGVYVLVAVPLVGWLLLHSAARTSGAPSAVAPGRRSPESGADGGLAFGAALRQRLFWLATGAFAIPAVVVTAVIFHQVAIFRWAGLPLTMVPLSFALLAAGQVATTALAGTVVDRWSPRAGAFLSAVLIVAGIGALILPGPEWLRVALHGGLLGGGTALSALAGTLVWPTLFGTRALGGLRAASSALRNAATAVGPIALVLVSPGEDLTTGLVLLAGLSLAGAALGWPLRAPRDEGV